MEDRKGLTWRAHWGGSKQQLAFHKYSWLLGKWQCFLRNSLTDGLNLSIAIPKFTHEARKSHVGEVLLSYLAAHTYFQGRLETPCPKEAFLLLQKINDFVRLALLGYVKYLEHIDKINHSKWLHMPAVHLVWLNTLLFFISAHPFPASLVTFLIAHWSVDSYSLTGKFQCPHSQRGGPICIISLISVLVYSYCYSRQTIKQSLMYR